MPTDGSRLGITQYGATILASCSSLSFTWRIWIVGHKRAIGAQSTGARKTWDKLPVLGAGKTPEQRRSDMLAAMAAVHRNMVQNGFGAPMEAARKIWPSVYARIRLMSVSGGDIDIHDACCGKEKDIYLMPFTLTDNKIVYYLSLPESRRNTAQLATRRYLSEWKGGRGRIARPHG